MKSKRKLIWIVFVVLFVSCTSYNKKILSKTVEIIPILELDALLPKVDINVMSLLSQNYFAIDNDNNVYIVDCTHHRVLKYDSDGKFILQIGSIGQEQGDLFNPSAVFIENNNVHILNEFGRQLKLFSKDGEYLKSFRIKNAWNSGSISVQSDKIAIGVKYNNKENYNSNKLISIFDIDGVLHNSIGKIIETKSHVGYNKFNSVFISCVENKLFGAFQNRPILFAYDLNGEELFYKDLREYNLNEINGIRDKEKSLGLDQPETKKTDYSLNFMTYCFGFCVNKNMHIFYAINMYDAASNTKRQSVIYHFDEQGQLIEKIFPMRFGENVKIKSLYTDKENRIIGISIINGNAFLFKLPKGGDEH